MNRPPRQSFLATIYTAPVSSRGGFHSPNLMAKRRQTTRRIHGAGPPHSEPNRRCSPRTIGETSPVWSVQTMDPHRSKPRRRSARTSDLRRRMMVTSIFSRSTRHPRRFAGLPGWPTHSTYVWLIAATAGERQASCSVAGLWRVAPPSSDRLPPVATRSGAAAERLG